jgi:hypothetical protein
MDDPLSGFSCMRDAYLPSQRRSAAVIWRVAVNKKIAAVAGVKLSAARPSHAVHPMTAVQMM